MKPNTTFAFTIRSWNNTAPDGFTTYEEALQGAKRRLGVEASLIKIRNNLTGEVQTVSDHGLSGWSGGDGITEKQIIADACDKIEDR